MDYINTLRFTDIENLDQTYLNVAMKLLKGYGIVRQINQLHQFQLNFDNIDLESFKQWLIHCNEYDSNEKIEFSSALNRFNPTSVPNIDIHELLNDLDQIRNSGKVKLYDNYTQSLVVLYCLINKLDVDNFLIKYLDF